MEMRFWTAEHAKPLLFSVILNLICAKWTRFSELEGG